jgi:vacuolar-type H+-ATPase catalytic subunit A/Vma1
MENKMQINEKDVAIINKLLMEFGENVIANSSQIESLLSDLSPDTIKENHLIVLSFKSGFVKAYLFREADDVASVNAIADAKNVLSEQYSLKDEAIQWIEAFWNEYENFQKFTKMDYAELRNIYLENLRLNKEIASLKKEIEDSKSLKEEYDKLQKAYDEVYRLYYEEMIN